ncbi:aconitase family protein [Tistrella mobilis]|uniref:3-isopropylmalate dehydratase large subunit n=1 Tax=Tistrella mobilis TaxID=171437 RepID=UPI0035575E6D
MGFTMAEKILARASGRETVRAGEEVQARPDFVLAYEFPGYTDQFFRMMAEDFGRDALDAPERFAIFIDHMVPSSTPAEEQVHQATRDWCAKTGATLYERRGIGHQVCVEEGYAAPGAFVVHYDGHVSQIGAYGALGVNLPRRTLIEAFVRSGVDIKVPETVRVDLTGHLKPGVMGRDVIHHLIRRLGVKTCRFAVLELGGPAVATLSDDALQSIAGQVMFLGALSCLVDLPDDRLAASAARGRIRLPDLRSDADAVYRDRISLDLSTLGPVVVAPPSPADTRDLAEFEGRPVQVGYLGSCASGRIEDLRVAAKLLEGRQIAPGFQLNIVPTSNAVMAQAAREGLIATLVEAGAFISAATCDFCYGRIGTMAPGQTAVSTGTLNVPGRMGSTEADIFICSAATVAASALEGRITDPRRHPEFADAV